MIFISCFSRRTSQHMKPAAKEQRDKGSLYENGHYDGRHHYVFSIHFHSWLRRQAWQMKKDVPSAEHPFSFVHIFSTYIFTESEMGSRLLSCSYIKSRYCCWRSASYTRIAAVFDRFSERTCSVIGKRRQRSIFRSIKSFGNPLVSLPNTKK